MSTIYDFAMAIVAAILLLAAKALGFTAGDGE